jgi:hypothetical protein
LEFTRPLFVGIGFAVKMVYNVAFAWWLDPWMQQGQAKQRERQHAGRGSEHSPFACGIVNPQQAKTARSEQMSGVW